MTCVAFVPEFNYVYLGFFWLIEKEELILLLCDLLS